MIRALPARKPASMNGAASPGSCHPDDERSSAPMALLYLDLLGMKSEWHAGGVQAALRRYREFNAVVIEGLSALPAGAIVGGGVQSDAVGAHLHDCR